MTFFHIPFSRVIHPFPNRAFSCVSQATPPVAHEPHGILRSNELSVGELVGCREWSDDVGIHVVHIPCSFQRCRRGEFRVSVAWKVISYTWGWSWWRWEARFDYEYMALECHHLMACWFVPVVTCTKRVYEYVKISIHMSHMSICVHVHVYMFPVRGSLPPPPPPPHGMVPKPAFCSIPHENVVFGVFLHGGLLARSANLQIPWIFATNLPKTCYLQCFGFDIVE